MLRVALVLAVVLVVSGCSPRTAFQRLTGYGSGADPSVTLKSAEARWLLIKNPRFGSVASEPEYVWVEEDKVPFSFKGMFSQRAVIASPEIVAQYGPPPGGGKISARQGVPYQATVASSAVQGTTPSAAEAPKAISAPAPSQKRGLVVWTDTTRIAIDLTARDGVRPGMVVSLRRDRIPIVHPITGEVLGDVDEEIATARVTELKEKFSVAEIQTVVPGSQIQVKDRVVLK